MPWDPVYLGNWFAFVKQLGDRYGDRPEFLMVGAAGPTSVSVEMTEPIKPNDIAKWEQNHYTSTKYIEAWQQTFEMYAKLFPNQYVSLSHGYGVPINAEGEHDPNQQSRNITEVVGEAWSTLGSQFCFQSSALTGGSHRDGAIQTVMSYNGRVVTGFQLASACIDAPTKMGAAGDPPLALMRSISHGMQPNDNGKRCDYIEVHAADVEAEQIQPVLRWGAALFQ